MNWTTSQSSTRPKTGPAHYCTSNLLGTYQFYRSGLFYPDPNIIHPGFRSESRILHKKRDTVQY
jgi:hypothetical protein